MVRLSWISGFLLLVACEKTSPIADPAPSKEPAPFPSAPPAVSSAPPSASAMPAALPSSAALGTVDAGKSKDAGGAVSKAVSKRVDGKNFALELASAGCKAASDCTMTIKLLVAGVFHVNKEYPYKFVATATPGVEFVGKGAPNTFTREAGDFVEQGEKTGIMTVRFRSASPGEARISGTYKLSVCSEDQCQIEQEKLDLTVPVM